MGHILINTIVQSYRILTDHYAMSSAAEMKQLQPYGANVPVIPNKISFWQRRNTLNSISYMSEEKHLSSYTQINLTVKV